MVYEFVQIQLWLLIVISFFQVDIFHLQTTFPSSNWKDDYNQNKKVVSII